jgi:hypothetical protein
MEICTSLITPALDLISAWCQCVTCESTSPRIEFSGGTSNEKIIERLQAVSSRRVEPKNRVLTLDEVRNTEKDAFDFMMHWLELKFEPHKCEGEETTCAIFAVSMYFDDESDDVIYSPAYVTDYYLFKKQYGKKWRCWLRKPTNEEMEGTSWEENRA